jgi:hypothetical protein
MSPCPSTTNPEPSADTRCFVAGVKNVGGTTSVCVAVITTTPGESRR